MLKEKGSQLIEQPKDANLMTKYYNYLRITKIKINIMIKMFKNNDMEIKKKVNKVNQRKQTYK